MSVNTKDIMKDLKTLGIFFDFGILNESHELVSKKDKKIKGKFKFETPKNIWIDEFVCLRSKTYAFKCGDDSKKNKRKF